PARAAARCVLRWSGRAWGEPRQACGGPGWAYHRPHGVLGPSVVQRLRGGTEPGFGGRRARPAPEPLCGRGADSVRRGRRFGRADLRPVARTHPRTGAVAPGDPRTLPTARRGRSTR